MSAVEQSLNGKSTMSIVKGVSGGGGNGGGDGPADPENVQVYQGLDGEGLRNTPLR